jgi:hypothetical protein
MRTAWPILFLLHLVLRLRLDGFMVPGLLGPWV